MKNKIKFGLKNVYRANVVVDDDGNVMYDTPVRVPGAVTLTLNTNVVSTDIPADDLDAYATLSKDNGYTGSIEFANLSDEDRVEILGNSLDENGVLIENEDDRPNEQALLFEINGDAAKKRHVLYNVLMTKPAVNAKTGKEPQSDTLDLRARPAVDTGNIKASVPNDAEHKNVYDTWYEEVYVSTKTSSEAE